MSTRMIHDVLLVVATGTRLSDDAREAARRALAELDAIRHVARAFTAEDATPEDIRIANATLERIAAEAKP